MNENLITEIINDIKRAFIENQNTQANKPVKANQSIEPDKLSAYYEAQKKFQNGAIELRVPCSGKYCAKNVYVSRYSWSEFEPFMDNDFSVCLCRECAMNGGRGAPLTYWQDVCPAIFREGATKTNPHRLPGVWFTLRQWDFESGLDGRRSIYINGESGAGKSRMLFLLLYHRVVLQRLNFIVLKGGELRERIMERYGAENNVGAASRYVTELASVPVLAFDDFGQDVLTDTMLAELWRLVDKRFSNGLPTIFLSNFSIKEMRERLNKKSQLGGSAGSMMRRIEEFSKIISIN